MLRQTSIHHGIILVVGVNDGVLNPLFITVPNVTLSIRKVLRAVHLTMRSQMRTESLILTNRMLHERSLVIHFRVDDLAACPLIRLEGRFIHMQNLIPSAHEVLLLKCFFKGSHSVAGDILMANLALIYGLEGLRDRHYYFETLINYYRIIVS